MKLCNDKYGPSKILNMYVSDILQMPTIFEKVTTDSQLYAIAEGLCVEIHHLRVAVNN